MLKTIQKKQCSVCGEFSDNYYFHNEEIYCNKCNDKIEIMLSEEIERTGDRKLVEDIWARFLPEDYQEFLDAVSIIVEQNRITYTRVQEIVNSLKPPTQRKLQIVINEFKNLKKQIETIKI